MPPLSLLPPDSAQNIEYMIGQLEAITFHVQHLAGLATAAKAAAAAASTAAGANAAAGPEAAGADAAGSTPAAAADARAGDTTTAAPSAAAAAVAVPAVPSGLTPDIVAVATEALILLEKDDSGLAARLQTLVGAPPLQHITRLRVACINLLCALLTLDDFRAAMLPTYPSSQGGGGGSTGGAPPATSAASAGGPDAAPGAAPTSAAGGAAAAAAAAVPEATLTKLRDDLMNMLLKNLSSPSRDIFGAAKAGLSTLVQGTRVPKQMMQVILKPLLGPLTFHYKLTVSFLQGLGRLLELLSDLFNQTLGDKLMEHLRRWGLGFGVRGEGGG